MQRCFISHANADREFVEDELLGIFEAVGVQPWYCKTDIPCARDWEAEVEKALRSTVWFAVVMSPRSTESLWVQKEVDWALSNRLGKVIPILMESCDLSRFHLSLPKIQYIDYRCRREGRHRLIRVLVDSVHGMVIRSSAPTGLWEGEILQEAGPDGMPVNFPVRLMLSTEKQSIEGKFEITVPPSFRKFPGDGPLLLQFIVTGGLLYERFIRLTYLSTDPTIVQFGAMVLEIDAVAISMSGRLIGYGAYSERIVSGTVDVERVQG